MLNMLDRLFNQHGWWILSGLAPYNMLLLVGSLVLLSGIAFIIFISKE